MGVFGYGATDVGLVRANNEDSFFVCNEGIGPLPNLFIVADGIGGSRAGEVASERAIYFFTEYIRQSQEKDITPLFFDAMKYANEEVGALADTDAKLWGMGTTFVAATVTENSLVFIHIGDSRLYIVSDKGIRRLTNDHTLANETLGHEDAKNVLTRWIGAPDFLEPQQECVELTSNDHVLLCSDGLNNMVTEDFMMTIINSGENGGLKEKAALLIEAAKSAGGIDNITVIII